MGKVASCDISIPYRHQLVYQLLLFQSDSLLMNDLRNAMEDGLRTWAPVIHVGDLEEAPDFDLVQL